MTARDDVLQAYQNVLFLMNRGCMDRIISMGTYSDVKNISDFVKGYYTNSFVTILGQIQEMHENESVADAAVFGEYVKKINEPPRLNNLIDELMLKVR